MNIWHAGEEEINQLYNNINIIVKAGSIKNYNDDLAVFLLNKRELRGKGLVQLKEGDNREERYVEARRNIYNWAKEKWRDYERHCEEREAQRLQPLKPHKEILKFKIIIDEYEKWEADGFPIPEEIIANKQKTENKVFVCPYCGKEMTERVGYFGHLRSHQKKEEEVNVNAGAVKNEGAGES